jgi:Ca2+-transporting ATPase
MTLKTDIQSVIQQFYEAGIQVKVVTGDNTVTTKAIAEMAGIKNTENVMEGEAFMKLNEVEMLKAFTIQPFNPYVSRSKACC